MCKLTIIIPHYNSINSLKKLLKSIPRLEEIQVIVVDDKSDISYEDFQNLKSTFDNVLFLCNTTNSKGAGVCRNIGINHIKGKWTLFADSDDFFLDDFYNKVKRYYNSTYDVIFFKPTSIEAETGELSKRHIKYQTLINAYSENKKNSDIRLRYKFYVPWSKLIRTDVIFKHQIKFDEVMVSNDIMFSTKLGYYAREITVDKEIIYCVTKGKNSLTTNLNENNFYCRTEIFMTYYNALHNKINKKEFDSLELHGLGVIVSAFQYKLGIKNTIKIIILLKKNNINIFHKKFFNPFIIFKKFRRILSPFYKIKSL